MSATRSVLLGGAFGGVSGGIAGGGIAQLFFGAEAHLLPLYVAAFIGAIVGGISSAFAVRSDLCKALSSDHSGKQSSG